MSDRFDDELFAILKESRTLPTFLDTIFGFLNRRTDFYVVSESPNAQVGLPDGFAETLVKNAFYKWKPRDLSEENVVPEAVVETEVVDTEIPYEKKDETSKKNEHISSDCYNGAQYDMYSWSQTISEVEILVKIPTGTLKKDIHVSIFPKRISVALKDLNGYLEGDLCNPCKHTEAIWSVDPERSRLEIHLEKRSEIWWDCLLKSEPRLDLSKLDCSRPFEELPEEAQAKIQELTWNQERKRLGLPTSDQLKMEKTLQRAWNADGSPFKGPFDPSTVTFG